MTQGFVNLLTSLRLSRLGMALVVAMLALTHLAGFAHFALVQHERCPEHGDWMHVHGSDEHRAPSADVSLNAQETADTHDHCSAPTALRERVAFRALLMPAEPLVPHLPPPAQLVRVAPLGLTPVTLHNAPKTSPPV